MSIIINAKSMEEYNHKINYYQANGFKVNGTTSMNHQTNLVKRNFGPIAAQILLIISLIGGISFLTEIVLDVLKLTHIIAPLNIFSLVLAVRYLQEIGYVLLMVAVIAALVIVYYYVTKPYEVTVRLSNENNINNPGFNGGNYNGGL